MNWTAPRVKITQFGSRESCAQKDIDRIQNRAGRLKASIVRFYDQVVENVQRDLHNYLKAGFVAIESPETTHSG